jgi:hypothetical protein
VRNQRYNGLGARNLIFILLQLLEFFKSFKATQQAPGLHLVFIEEPEAHLHPQMAEVFIRKLTEITAMFVTMYNDGVPWPVQFVVSTHSSHMANEARFEAIRYFLATSESQANHLRQAGSEDRHCVGRFCRSRGKGWLEIGSGSEDGSEDRHCVGRFCRSRGKGWLEIGSGSEDRHCVGRFYRSRGKGWLEIGRIDLASKLACRRGINPIRSVENP